MNELVVLKDVTERAKDIVSSDVTKAEMCVRGKRKFIKIESTTGNFSMEVSEWEMLGGYVEGIRKEIGIPKMVFPSQEDIDKVNASKEK